MDQVGVRELKQNASAVLRRVKAGETIEVTDRGLPVAILAPIRQAGQLDELLAQGRATPAVGDLREYLKTHPPLPAAPDSPTASEVLAELRADER
ncbi:MAG TPA: type II toxin-antitoxin system prevent-host-death family antitoxin [Chloroflexota bacterium]|jgi:prevent-host-death family protein|nr:type II toxin-antitoxin system prevent-host-death family antitoxin [Chloroflexota bacterium]